MSATQEYEALEKALYEAKKEIFGTATATVDAQVFVEFLRAHIDEPLFTMGQETIRYLIEKCMAAMKEAVHYKREARQYAARVIQNEMDRIQDAYRQERLVSIAEQIKHNQNLRS